MGLLLIGWITVSSTMWKSCKCKNSWRWHSYYCLFIRSAFWYRYNDAALQTFLANLMILHSNLYFIRVRHILMMVLVLIIAIAVWPYFCTYVMGNLFMDHFEWIIIQLFIIPAIFRLYIRKLILGNKTMLYVNV